MASEIVGSSELREGGGSVKVGQGQQLIFASRWKFLVVADSTSVTREEILLGTPGLPIVGLVYGITQQKCTSKSAERKKENALYWDVVCEFESGAENQKQSEDNPDSPDPTTWVPVFVIDSFETKQKVIYEDFANIPKVVKNFADQLYSEPLVKTCTLCSFSFVQFEDPSQDIDDIMDRNDTINQTAFQGRAVRTCKLNVTGAELGYFGTFNAWKVSYRVTYDPDTWDVELLEVGTVYKDTADGNKIKPYMDETGSHRIVGKLDTNGNKLASASTALTTAYVPFKQIPFTFIRTV
jgi:hypothetical protein